MLDVKAKCFDFKQRENAMKFYLSNLFAWETLAYMLAFAIAGIVGLGVAAVTTEDPGFRLMRAAIIWSVVCWDCSWSPRGNRETI